MCICPPQDCMSGPWRGPGRLAGGVGPARHREDAREIETYHDWLRAWQCVWAVRPTTTILRVFRLVPGHQGGVRWGEVG